MKRFYMLAIIAMVVAGSIGCRSGRWAAFRDGCLGRHRDNIECDSCNSCGVESGIIYEGGPIYEQPSESYTVPSVTLPAPASYVPST